MRRSCRRILKHTFERILHEAVVNADTPEKQELGNLADIVHPSASFPHVGNTIYAGSRGANVWPASSV